MRVGWSADGSYHWLPGRLLVKVPALLGSASFAAGLEAWLASQPGVTSASASAVSGRVLLTFETERADASALVSLARSWQPGWVIATVSSTETLTAEGQLCRLDGLGRRRLRRLGPRAFGLARAMQRRGEFPLGLVKGTQCVGLVGARWHGTDFGSAEVAATAEAEPVAWHNLQGEQALAVLGGSPLGLDGSEAAERLARFGPNELAERAGPSSLSLFLNQLREPMALLLLGAAGLSFLLKEQLDALVIIGIVGVNALLAVLQEVKTRGVLSGLTAAETAMAQVWRDDQLAVVPASELVVGDLVQLEAGEAVPADLRLLSAAGLTTAEAALTGESVEVEKLPTAVLGSAVPLADRCNMAYMGTFVRRGRGQGVVVATGMQTEMGRIAHLLQEADPGPTPLQRRLAQVNRWLVLGSFVASALMVGLGLWRGLPLGQLVLGAVSTAVAAIPEGLPITVTIALALAVFRTGRRQALVRRLPIMESLGATTVICTDKTGTLTQGQMAVRSVWAGGRQLALDAGSPDLVHLLAMASLCTNASLEAGDPTEVAILKAALAAGVDSAIVERRYARLRELPFESASRCMTVVCANEQGDLYTQVKGAPEAVLARCEGWHQDGGSRPLTSAQAAWMLDEAEAMAARGLRVLAVAYKPLPEAWEAGFQSGLIFAGLLGIQDPPRAEVFSALARCQQAGVRVLVLTGDHPQTAQHVAAELGLAGPVLTGAALAELGVSELATALEGAAVCARVTPDQKLRVVRALRSAGHVVAMVGDGVNDAPAIAEADVGIAMGRQGSAVTQGSADLVLLDDDFATIVGAIEEGRGAFANIRRTVRYTLATNAAEVVLMLGAMLVGLPLPLLPVHLLFANLVCDGIPALSLAFDRPAPGTLEQPPRRPDEGLFSGGLWQRVFVRGVALGLGILGLFAGLGRLGGLAVARSAALAALVVSKMLYLFEVRPPALGRNRVLAAAVGVTAGLVLASLYLPALQPVFRTVALGPLAWLGVGLVAWLSRAAEGLTSCRRSGLAQ